MPALRRIGFQNSVQNRTAPDATAPWTRNRWLCERLLEIVPGMAAATAVAQRLVRMLQHKSTEPLQDVLDAMKATLLDRLAQSLEMDAAAVQAALETPWTTGPVEG
jgi:transposase